MGVPRYKANDGIEAVKWGSDCRQRHGDAMFVVLLHGFVPNGIRDGIGRVANRVMTSASASATRSASVK
jgi:hypothetical protein